MAPSLGGATTLNPSFSESDEREFLDSESDRELESEPDIIVVSNIMSTENKT